MPIGLNDEDKPEFLPIAQTDVKKALLFRTFWIALHVVTCVLIIAGNGRVLSWWSGNDSNPAHFFGFRLISYLRSRESQISY